MDTTFYLYGVSIWTVGFFVSLGVLSDVNDGEWKWLSWVWPVVLLAALVRAGVTAIPSPAIDTDPFLEEARREIEQEFPPILTRRDDNFAGTMDDIYAVSHCGQPKV